MKTKAQISCIVTPISAFFRYLGSRIPLLSESEISSHRLWLYNITFRSLYRLTPNWFPTLLALQDTSTLHTTWQYSNLSRIIQPGLCGFKAWFVWDLVRNPEGRFKDTRTLHTMWQYSDLKVVFRNNGVFFNKPQRSKL